MIRPPELEKWKSKRKAMHENCILKIVARCWKSCGLAHCEGRREDYTVSQNVRRDQRGVRAKYRRVREVVATPASHEEAIRLAFLFGQLSFVFCV